MRIVPTFQPLKDCQFGLRVRLESTSIQQFAFQGGKEALGHGIVVRIADRPDRGHDTHFLATLAKGITRVLPGFNRSSQRSSCSDLISKIFIAVRPDADASEVGSRSA